MQDRFIAHINQFEEVQDLQQHCKGTAALSAAVLEKVKLKNTGLLIGLLHDAGKCTEEFNAYIQKAHNGEQVQRGSVIHTFTAVSYLLTEYHKQPDITAEFLSIAIGSHHGLFDCFDDSGTCGFEHRLRKQPEYDKRAIEAFTKNVVSKEEIDRYYRKAADEITTIIETANMCNERESDFYVYLALLSRLMTSALIDADRTDTARFMNGIAENNNIRADAVLWDTCLKNLDAYMADFPNDTAIQKARKALSDECWRAAAKHGRMYKLNIPTGGGKTLSGLRFALKHAKEHNKERIFFISPLLSILEQNAGEIRKAIKNDEIILEHHSDMVFDGEDPTTEYRQYESLCETWGSPVIITTLVQLLNTLFSAKTSSVRRFCSLINSVIVIDEVQTVPLKMLSLFNTAINFLTDICGTTVVLCSATQPEFGKIEHALKPADDIVPAEKLVRYGSVFKRNRIIDRGRVSIEDIPQTVTELTQTHKSVLVICNKKSQAAELTTALGDTEAKVYHLSAGMCIAHRKQVIEEIKCALKQKEKVICISTQVIEAGVDISFEAVIRFCAGMDSIVQAAGRCNRHGELTGEAPVCVVNCKNENLQMLKEIKDAKAASESLLEEYKHHPEMYNNDIASNEAVSWYYQKLYESVKREYFDYKTEGNPSMYSLLSENVEYTGELGEKYYMHQAFKKAGTLFKVFDEDQRSVIVPWNEGNQIIGELLKAGDDITKELLDKAKPYAVTVYSYQFNKLTEAGAITALCDGTVFLLDEAYYDDRTGVYDSTEGGKICDTLIL